MSVMSNSLYVYRDEDKHAVAVARPHTGPNGGFSAHHVAKMALPGKRLTQAEIDGFAAMFAAAPDMLEALQDAMAIIETPVSQTPKSLLKRVAAIRAAIAKAEGR